MILPVYVYGQPVLRKEAEDITPDYPNLKELIQNMFETMDRADGCGLRMVCDRSHRPFGHRFHRGGYHRQEHLYQNRRPHR